MNRDRLMGLMGHDASGKTESGVHSPGLVGAAYRAGVRLPGGPPLLVLAVLFLGACTPWPYILDPAPYQCHQEGQIEVCTMGLAT